VLQGSSLVLAKLAAPALVGALSPVSVVVALVLLIHNDRPQSSGIAYLLGRLIALAALTTGFMQVPRLFDNLIGPAPPWTDWVVMVIGAVLTVVGAWLWWQRTQVTDSPGWESRVSQITPVMSAAIGLFPPLANPKVLAASAAAGAAIATVHLNAIGAAAAVVYYAALANATVAAPVLIYLIVGPRIDPQLERIRRWIQNHHRSITALVLIIIGGAVMLYGLT
jgi:hypothetical protein